MTTSIFTFFSQIFEFFKSFFEVAIKVWNWEFELNLGPWSFNVTFQGIATTSLIAVLGLLLVKKLAPLV